MLFIKKFFFIVSQLIHYLSWPINFFLKLGLMVTSAIGHMSEPIEIHIYEKNLIKRKKNISIYILGKKLSQISFGGINKEILSIKFDNKIFRFFLELFF